MPAFSPFHPALFAAFFLTFGGPAWAGEPASTRGRDADRPHLVIVMAESEYQTDETLPRFARKHLQADFRISLVFANPRERNDIPGLEALDDADAAIFSIRRRAPREKQMAHIRKFFAAGKPLVALRTTSHAFHLKGKETPAGHAVWNEFDREILGGHYRNHHGNSRRIAVTRAEGAAGHPILAGVDPAGLTDIRSLYRSAPLSKTATPLLIGTIEDAAPEPIAWTNHYGSFDGEELDGEKEAEESTSDARGRVFYTSVAAPENFENPQFIRLLRNAVYWTSGRKIPSNQPGRIPNPRKPQ